MALTPSVAQVLEFTIAGIVKLAIFLGVHATVFQTGVLGIMLTTRACGRAVPISSDSQAAIRAIVVHI